MDRSFKHIISVALCSIALTTNASDIKISSDSIEKSQDGVTIVYIGNVEMTTEDTHGFKISSAQITSEGSQDIYEGDVKITIDSLKMMTDRAVVTRQANMLHINMDQVTTFER